MTLPGPDHPLQLVFGLTLWTIWFTMVYAGVSIACDVAPSDLRSDPWNLVTGALLMLTMLVIALMSWAAWRCARAARLSTPPPDRRRFVAWLASALYATSAASTAFVGLPLLALPPCA